MPLNNEDFTLEEERRFYKALSDKEEKKRKLADDLRKAKEDSAYYSSWKGVRDKIPEAMGDTIRNAASRLFRKSK